MHGPRYLRSYPDRFLECEEAMEDHFIELMEAAESAGWTADEAATAVTSLADHYLLKLFALDETLSQLVGAKLKRP